MNRTKKMNSLNPNILKSMVSWEGKRSKKRCSLLVLPILPVDVDFPKKETSTGIDGQDKEK